MTDRIRYQKEPRREPRLLSYYPPVDVEPRQIAYRQAEVPITPIQQAHPYVMLLLRVPAEEPNPIQAIEMLLALVSLGRPLLLRIRISQDIDFAVITHRDDTQAVIRALRGSLPKSDISIPEEYPCPPERALCYSCTIDQPNRPDTLPLREISSFTNSDSLTAIIESILPLGQDESATIDYHVNLPDEKRLEGAYKELTVPAPIMSLADLFTIMIGKGARMPKYERSLQRQLEERLNLPVSIIIKPTLIGNDLSKLKERARSLYSVFATRFLASSEGIYLDSWSLTVPEILPKPIEADSSPGLILSLGELASLYHMPSSRVTSPGINFLKYPATEIPIKLTQARGILLGTTRSRGGDVPIHLNREDFHEGHAAIPTGPTGAGKTTLLCNMAKPLVRAPDRPALVLKDPHGKAALQIASQVIPDERVEDTYLFELGGDPDYDYSLPLFQRPERVPVEDYIEVTSETFKIIFPNIPVHPRMADTFQAITATLCYQKQASLLDIYKLFNKPNFRRKALANVKDPVTLEWWEWFEQQSASLQRELSNPILTRVRSLYNGRATREILCQPTGVDLGQLFKERRICLFSYAGSQIRTTKDLIGEVVLAKLHLDFLARLSQPEESLVRTYLMIDESQRYKGPTLPVLLSEARKGLMTLVFATQFIKQWSPALAEAVLANVGTIISFRAGPSDSSVLARMMKPFSPDDLENLNRYECFVKMQLEGNTLPAIHVRTAPLVPVRNESAQRDVLEQIRAQTRQRFGKPRSQLDTHSPPEEFRETEDIEED